MEEVRFVGLDVHKESIAIAVAEERGGEPSTLSTIPNDSRVLLKQLRRLGRVRCCYEAGPTGFVLQRELTANGIDCIVVAPSLVPQSAGDRVKTDRRDAMKLARFLRSGDLTAVHVPEPATEAMRDFGACA
jgi:transposase